MPGRGLCADGVRGGGRVLAVAAVLAALALGGCSAPVRPDLPTASPPAAAVRVPADGLSLRSFGIVNGPASAFSLPRDAVVTTRVDEPSGVTAVLGSPSPADVAAYLRRTLPRTGFTVTADDPATASLLFTGYGWTGSFTGSGSTSAVVLRP